MKKVFLIPDILANAGGVTVSYFEWVQDLQQFFWSERDINVNLRKIMVKAFDEVLQMSKNHEVDMRTGAYMLAVKRVADAIEIRGIFPYILQIYLTMKQNHIIFSYQGSIFPPPRDKNLDPP